MNWQEKNAKAEMLGAGIAGAGCLGFIVISAIFIAFLMLI